MAVPFTSRSDLMEHFRPFRWLSELRARRRGRRHARRDAHRRAVAEAVWARYGPLVQSGPFQGMRYPWLEAGGSVLTPKLLGTYEEEVHSFLRRIAELGPRQVVNVGCGEGYYAVGLARLLPEARVFAFDASERSQGLCRELASANDVASRVHIAGTCGPEDLRDAAREGALVVCDIEGGEMELLQPARVPGLLDCDLLVELHRVRGVRSTAESIRSRFAATHTAELVRYRERDPRRYPAVGFLSRRDRKTALDERRRRGREWMLLLRRRG